MCVQGALGTPWGSVILYCDHTRVSACLPDDDHHDYDVLSHARKIVTRGQRVAMGKREVLLDLLVDCSPFVEDPS